MGDAQDAPGSALMGEGEGGGLGFPACTRAAARGYFLIPAANVKQGSLPTNQQLTGNRYECMYYNDVDIISCLRTQG